MSSEDLKSLIVTDPDIVDEGIDISGLRTQTDTDPRLLASIADFPGISYDPTEFSYLSDLNELFAYGLPTTETDQAQIPGAIDTLVDTGGGGDGGETQTFTPPTSGGGNTFIGGGATLEDAGGTYDGYQSAEGGFEYTGTPMDIGFGEGQVDPKLADAVGGIDTTPVSGGNLTTLPSGDVYATDDPMLSEKIDYTPEQQSTLQNILGKAGQTVEGALTELGKIPGAITDFTNQTVDIFGKKLNVGKTLAGLAINAVVGAPVNLVFDVLGSVLPQDSLENKTTRSIVDELKAEKDYGFNMQYGNLNQDPFGRNPVSQFGDYEGTLAKDAVSTSTTKMGLAKKEFAQDYFDKKAIKSGGVEVEDGTVLGPGEAPGEVITLEEQLQERQDKQDAALTESISKDIGVEGEDEGRFTEDTTDDFDDGTMTGKAADTMDDVLGPMPEEINIVDEVALTGGGGGGERDGGGSTSSPGFSAPSQQGQSPRGSSTGGGGNGDGGGCFLAGTLITMLDGSKKPVEKVDLGDNVAIGGKVFAVGRFLNTELYDYKGIKVSGSHMVNEDGTWLRVRDTKHGKSLGDDEHTVYVFGSENRRILINGILFTDYFETTEQEKLINNEKDFFNNWKTYENKIDQDNINILNAS